MINHEDIFKTGIALLAFVVAFYAVIARERKTPYMLNSIYAITLVVLAHKKTPDFRKIDTLRNPRSGQQCRLPVYGALPGCDHERRVHPVFRKAPDSGSRVGKLTPRKRQSSNEYSRSGDPLMREHRLVNHHHERGSGMDFLKSESTPGV